MSPFKKELEYFLILCDCLKISEAAEKAGIQQAGMSKALKSLESSFGGQLFYRTNRGLKLTPLGKVLQQGIHKSSKTWEDCLSENLNAIRDIAGSFILGIHKTVATNSIGNFFPKLSEQYPGLDLKLRLKSSTEITKAVVDHEIDMGIVAKPHHHPDLVITPLLDEFIGLWSVKPKNHKKVLYYNSEMIEIFHTLRKYSDFKKVAIDDYDVIAAFAMDSEGISILPNPVAEKYPSLIQIGKKISDVKICLIYRHDHPKTGAFNELKNLILKETLG